MRWFSVTIRILYARVFFERPVADTNHQLSVNRIDLLFKFLCLALDNGISELQLFDGDLAMLYALVRRGNTDDAIQRWAKISFDSRLLIEVFFVNIFSYFITISAWKWIAITSKLFASSMQSCLGTDIDGIQNL